MYEIINIITFSEKVVGNLGCNSSHLQIKYSNNLPVSPLLRARLDSIRVFVFSERIRCIPEESA
jgi:hypothetical protein